MPLHPRRCWLLLNVLNVIDGVLTLAVLARGGAELNPLAGTLLSRGAWGVLAKLLIVGVLSVGLARAGRRRVLLTLSVAYALACATSGVILLVGA